jgi:predicted RNase H-like HicB family nuclease
MNNPAHYPANVFWSDEDRHYIATAPDLPGCSAGGDTQAEALAELEHAIASWIEAAKAVGSEIPTPTDLARAPKYSGRFVVRMPTDLHARLAELAQMNGVSLNQYIVYQLARTSGADVNGVASVDDSRRILLRAPVPEPPSRAVDASAAWHPNTATAKRKSKSKAD